MANPLNRFQKGQVLTASALNNLVDRINEQDRRIQSQQLRPGVGYNFSTSTGGTSLQIIPKNTGDETTTSSPFKVSITKGDFEGGFNYAVSATSGTVFGTDGNSASYVFINKADDEGKPEDDQKLYTYVDLDEESTYIVCAKLEATACDTVSDWTDAAPDIQDDPDDHAQHEAYIMSEAVWQSIQSIMEILVRPVVHSIPYKCSFQYIDAIPLSEWRGNALYAVGQEASSGNEGSTVNDYYGIAGGWNVYFPLALITFKDGNPSLQQLLHSDIYFYAHWTRSI